MSIQQEFVKRAIRVFYAMNARNPMEKYRNQFVLLAKALNIF